MTDRPVSTVYNDSYVSKCALVTRYTHLIGIRALRVSIQEAQVRELFLTPLDALIVGIFLERATGQVRKQEGDCSGAYSAPLVKQFLRSLEI